MNSDAETLRVLVVDDEKLSRQTSVKQLLRAGFTARAVENGYRALEALDQEAWDVLLVDLRMPGMDGIELLRQARGEHPSVDVIVMTAHGTVKTAVEAMQEGAVDYLTKPFHFEELEHRLRRLGELRAYRDEVQTLRGLVDTAEAWGIVGRSPGILAAVDRIRTFAEHSAPVLVVGETGTGKELAARAIHRGGPRAGRPFVAVACGAIPTDLAESELFGHERGAFTGATTQRLGTFERAHGGTLLLDDVDDLPLALQAKLLRALQDGTFTRVGGQRELHTDARVIATTKVDLAAAVESGTFRDDLYYRLRGLEVHLPPLRERSDDLLLLAQHFLRRHARAGGRGEISLSPEVAAHLQRHSWPGNVRELARTIEAAVTLCADGCIQRQHLPAALFGNGEGEPHESRLFSLHLRGRDEVPFAELVRQFEDELLSWAMRRAGGQQTHAADLLGLARTTFQSKLGRSHGGTD